MKRNIFDDWIEILRPPFLKIRIQLYLSSRIKFESSLVFKRGSFYFIVRAARNCKLLHNKYIASPGREIRDAILIIRHRPISTFLFYTLAQERFFFFYYYIISSTAILLIAVRQEPHLSVLYRNGFGSEEESHTRAVAGSISEPIISFLWDIMLYDSVSQHQINSACWDFLWKDLWCSYSSMHITAWDSLQLPPRPGW